MQVKNTSNTQDQDITMGRDARGRGRGRFQGRGRTNRPNQAKGKEPNKQQDPNTAKFVVGTAKQASEYTKIKKYCINQIKMKYKQGIYIGTALENGQEYDFSGEKPSTLVIIKEEGNDDEILQKRGINESNKIEFQMNMAEYTDKVKTYAENKIKAYSFLWEKCSSQMKQNLESKSDYASHIKNNPFELLRNIESLSYNYQESKYEVAIIADAIRTFVNLKQKEEETLSSYLERFKAANDNMITQKGSEIVLTKYMESMNGYDPDNNKPFVRKAYEEYLAYTFLINSDQNKYGSLIKNLAQQQSLGNTQYPKSLTAASEVLLEHQWDSKYYDNRKNKKDKEKRAREQDNDNTTIATNNTEELELSFAQLENACYCCGKKGHSSNKCFQKDKIPKEQWYVNRLQRQETTKIQQHIQISDTASVTTATTAPPPPPEPVQPTTTASLQEWSGAHILCNNNNNRFNNMKDYFLLDNGSSTSIFANPRMVQNIREVTTPLQLITNGGDVITNTKATVPGFGDVWFDSNSIANIFSFAELKQKHRITYDSTKEDAFLIHLPTKIIKFSRTNEGLYTYKPNEHVLNKTILLQTVKENKQFYTNRQIARANLARKLYHNIGTPSIADFKAIIRMNAISNCPITIEDINIAEHIYGKDIGSLKGKTVRSKPVPVIRDYVVIPKELIMKHEQIELAIDLMFLHKIPFLTSISKNIMYRTAQPLEDKSPASYRSALDTIFCVYNYAGFNIRTIKADQEFKPLLDEIKDDLNIQMNYASAQEHVPEAERNNRTIKERFRAHYQRLPFHAIPKIMIKALVMECTKK